MFEPPDHLLMSAAQRYLRESFRFQSETGYSPGKANELLSALAVNRWLDTNGYRWKIQIASKPTGVDGTMVGEVEGPRDVEFKSSKAASFQFNPAFDYAAHGCIVMTQFKDGLPARIFVAIGAASIALIQAMAVADTRRDNFNKTKIDMAQVHVTAKPGGDAQRRPEAVEGLLDQLGKPESNHGPNRFVMIEGDALAALFSE